MSNRSSVRIALCVLVLSWKAFAFETAVNEHSKRIADFEAHVAAYLKLHQKALAGLPRSKPTNSPEEITRRQSELAAKVRALRPKAKQGEIFTPEISAEFHRLVSISWQGRDAVRMKASLRSSEPVRIALHINGEYPDQVPLQSTPPTLLQNLPALPKELEYRIVNHALVLRDVAANLIVDFTDSFIP